MVAIRPPHRPLLSFIRNPAWTSPISFKAWEECDLTSLYQLLTSTGLVYFSDLCLRYGLPLWEVFRYLQIKNFLLAHLHTFVVSFPMRQFESKCLKDPHALGLISLLYNGLLLQSFSDLPSYVRKWASDLCVRLETTDWSQIWKSTKSCSVSVIALAAGG